MGLGCLRMSEQGGGVDDVESIATLHMAFDLGINFLDTSANYGQGHNHRLIASALKGRREKVIVHTKSGSPRTPDSSGSRTGSSPEYLTRICEESLQRLEIETLDIFCMSRVDPNIPIEESVGAMSHLVEQGKTRYISLSEASSESIQRANRVHPIVSLQMEYSLWSRDPEAGNIQASKPAMLAKFVQILYNENGTYVPPLFYTPEQDVKPAYMHLAYDADYFPTGPEPEGTPEW